MSNKIFWVGSVEWRQTNNFLSLALLLFWNVLILSRYTASKISNTELFCSLFFRLWIICEDLQPTTRTNEKIQTRKKSILRILNVFVLLREKEFLRYLKEKRKTLQKLNCYCYFQYYWIFFLKNSWSDRFVEPYQEWVWNCFTQFNNMYENLNGVN